MNLLVFYIFYFVVGAAFGFMITNYLWHKRMAIGYHRLSLMAAADHIPTAHEVNMVFGGPNDLDAR